MKLGGIKNNIIINILQSFGHRLHMVFIRHAFNINDDHFRMGHRSDIHFFDDELG